MPTSDPRQRLLDIINNGDRIQRHVAGYDRSAFIADDKTVDSVERCFQRITEAAIKLDDVYGDGATYLGADEIRALRRFGNRLRHHYETIDADQLWTYVIEELPPLVDAARSEFAAIDDPSGSASPGPDA